MQVGRAGGSQGAIYGPVRDKLAANLVQVFRQDLDAKIGVYAQTRPS